MPERAADSEQIALQPVALLARSREAGRDHHDGLHALGGALPRGVQHVGGRHRDHAELDLVRDVRRPSGRRAPTARRPPTLLTGYTGPSKPGARAGCGTARRPPCRAAREAPITATDRGASTCASAARAATLSRLSKRSIASGVADVGALDLDAVAVRARISTGKPLSRKTSIMRWFARQHPRGEDGDVRVLRRLRQVGEQDRAEAHALIGVRDLEGHLGRLVVDPHVGGVADDAVVGAGGDDDAVAVAVVHVGRPVGGPVEARPAAEEAQRRSSRARGPRGTRAARRGPRGAPDARARWIRRAARRQPRGGPDSRWPRCRSRSGGSRRRAGVEDGHVTVAVELARRALAQAEGRHGDGAGGAAPELLGEWDGHRAPVDGGRAGPDDDQLGALALGEVGKHRGRVGAQATARTAAGARREAS